MYSDGTDSPDRLVRMAVKNGLQGIALTDHDTVEGIEEFLASGMDNDIQLIPGLEISATHRDFSLHILGYGIDHRNRELVAWLNKLQDGREARNRRIIDKLREMGHDLHYEELQAISCCGQAGRPHIARLMQDRGIVQSPEEAFSCFLRKGGPAWSGRFSYSAAESIDMIHRAGGIAVLAHPGILEQHTRALSLVMAELVERGLDGIEAYYPTHSTAMEKKMRSFARKYQLVLTGGSDYHGQHRTFSSMSDTRAGFCPPDSLLEPLLERITNPTRQAQSKVKAER